MNPEVAVQTPKCPGPWNPTPGEWRCAGHAPCRTGGMSAVESALARARASIAPRVGASDLEDEVAAGAILVDIRSAALRERDGDLPGAIVVERNVLEWRLDPEGAHRLAEMDSPGRRVVLVCDEGYASSLAAAQLRDLGISNATDLAGGYQAWRAYHATERLPGLLALDSDGSGGRAPSAGSA
jgi:rhodanese-related sulfurtransferase